MKRTELAKQKGKKLDIRMSQAGTPERFGKAAAGVPDRREQRKRDQALGLVPFAVKLDAELVKKLHALAQERGIGLSEATGELLSKALQKK